MPTTFLRRFALVLALGFIAMLAASAQGQTLFYVYEGSINVIGNGGVEQPTSMAPNAPAAWTATAGQTTGADPKNIVVSAGDAPGFVTSHPLTSPPTFFGVTQSTQILTVTNQAGTLSAGGAPGALTWKAATAGPPWTTGQPGTVQFIPQSPTEFGGTLDFLYKFQTNSRIVFGPATILVGNASNPFRPGISFTDFFSYPFFFETPGGNLTATGQLLTGLARHHPWTTGKVIAKAPLGVAPTTVTSTGNDTRVSGVGTIQLVTPSITSGNFLGGVINTAFNSPLTLNFVPESGATAGLLGGAVLLFVLGAITRRRR